eukprot:g3082.t1
MDKRFAAVHRDPRFARRSVKKQTKVTDDRFSALATDKDYSFGLSAEIDKYGRKQERDEENQQAEKSEELKQARLNRLARGEASGSDYSTGSSSSESSANESSDSDSSESDDDLQEGNLSENTEGEKGEYFNENLRQHENIPLGKETNRLALMNMDWEHLKATDIYALMQSFVSSTGSVSSVTVYPSEFGKKRMKLENQVGPTSIYNSPQASVLKKDKDFEIAASSGRGGLDVEKVRQYERDKLRYYFAVVKFNSTNTAAAVYKECDGLEFETSSNVLDLRFIPDDILFSGEYRDTAANIPTSYKPPPWFATAALQQSNVALSWDASDDERKGLTRWHANNGETKASIHEENLRSYLAEISDEDQEDLGQKKRGEVSNLRQLLGLSSADDEDTPEERSRNHTIPVAESNDDDVLEITFTPGLEENLMKQRKRNQIIKNESIFDKYQREKREKKKRKKKDAALSTNASGNDDSDVGKKRNLMHLTLMKNNATQLGDGKDTNNVDKIVGKNSAPPEKRHKKRKKGKKKKETEEDDNFTIDLNDPRFKAVYNDANYAIDPTDSKFQATDNMNLILKAKGQKR